MDLVGAVDAFRRTRSSLQTVPDDGGSGRIVRSGIGDPSPATTDPSIAHFNAPLAEQIRFCRVHCTTIEDGRACTPTPTARVKPEVAKVVAETLRAEAPEEVASA